MRRRAGLREFRGPQRLGFDVLVRIERGATVHAVDLVAYGLARGDTLWIHPGQVQQWGDIGAIDGPVALFPAALPSTRTRSPRIRATGMALRSHFPTGSAGSGQGLAWSHLRHCAALAASVPESLGTALVAGSLAALLLELVAGGGGRPGAARRQPAEDFLRLRDAIEEGFAPSARRRVRRRSATEPHARPPRTGEPGVYREGTDRRTGGPRGAADARPRRRRRSRRSRMPSGSTIRPTSRSTSPSARGARQRRSASAPGTGGGLTAVGTGPPGACNASRHRGRSAPLRLPLRSRPGASRCRGGHGLAAPAATHGLRDECGAVARGAAAGAGGGSGYPPGRLGDNPSRTSSGCVTRGGLRHRATGRGIRAATRLLDPHDRPPRTCQRWDHGEGTDRRTGRARGPADARPRRRASRDDRWCLRVRRSSNFSEYFTQRAGNTPAVFRRRARGWEVG